MPSLDLGKAEVCEWIRKLFLPDSLILDVGACDGKWRVLLWDYDNIDAVEVFKPNADNLRGYRQVFNADVSELEYGYYDLIIFGDVLEHMTVENAQKSLKYAEEHSKCVIVGVPFKYAQGAIYGNPYERHIQDDLTRDLFAERYDGYAILCDCAENYCYYYKAGGRNKCL